MKKTLLLAWALFICAISIVKAQWSTDPNNPLVVCNAPGGPNTVRAVQDGNSGYFVFWRDFRYNASRGQIYGQKYDNNGIPQWTANGKAIYADTAKGIWDFSVIRNSAGHLLIGFTEGATANDTIRCIKINTSGNPMWASPALIGGNNGSVGGPSEIQLLEKNNGAYIGYILSPQGANVYINRIDSAGNVFWGFNGYQVPNAGYGGFGIKNDGTGGVFIYWRDGNGAGTHLGVRRMDANGNFLWTGNTDPTAGTPGLAYDFRAVYDNNYGLIITWVESGANIQMARIDSSGALTWSPGVMPVCVESNSQDRCRILMHGNYFFVAWEDGRPPANYSDVYIQKFNMSGQPQWTVDGIRASSGNTYIPYTQMVPSDSGSVICTNESNGLQALRVRADSTSAWGLAGTPMCIGNSLAPFYDGYVLLPSSDFGAVAFWYSNYINYNVYAAKVGFSGTLVNTEEITLVENGFTIFPNPAKDNFTITINAALTNAHLKIFNVLGENVFEKNISSALKTEIDLKNIAAGLYFVKVFDGEKQFCEKLIVEHD